MMPGAHLRTSAPPPGAGTSTGGVSPRSAGGLVQLPGVALGHHGRVDTLPRIAPASGNDGTPSPRQERLQNNGR